MVKKTKRNIKLDFKSRYAGVHLLIDFWGGKKIEEPKKLERILVAAAKKANNTPLKVSIHKFYPQGVTGIILLAESHIAVHAWPEYDYIAIDIFTCGRNALPYRAFEYFKKIYQPKRVKIREIKRGKR